MKDLFYFCIGVLFCNLNLSKAHYTQQWAVHIQGGKQVADAVAKDHGFVNHGLIFDDHYHFTHSDLAKRSLRPNAEKKAKLAVDTRVTWSEQQRAKRRVKRDLKVLDSDPKWPFMWYLNRGGGLDMNVIPAWMEGITGKGAVVTILDDGLEKDHPDLLQNYDPMASYDVNGQDTDPSPRYDMIDSNRHGTRCAGEVAATSNNSVCALGVAHGAQVGGVRMLDGEVTDAVEARSLSLNPHHIDIYSASWGPDDDGKTVDGPGELATRAFIEGVSKGRNGKGSIFVWASGNGGRDHDNCNCDGYTNSIYSLSISSVTEHGHVPWYSEACSSTLASTYSSGAVGERQVVTTDLKHSCTSSHTGTSASAPLAAGICALALEANPNLTWRDMQHIVVRTARPQNLIAGDWQTNGVGRRVSHSFGYGLMDAYAMVQLSRNWTTVPEQSKCEVTAQQVPKNIPPKSMVTLQLQVKDCEGVDILEHVQAKLTIFSQRRGDLNIQLTSPMGTKVVLLAHRPHDNSRAGFTKWPFMSVHSWGETPIGTWQLEIHNDGRLLGRASLQNWTLVFYGTRYFVPNLNNNEKNKHRSGSNKRKNKKHKNKNLKKPNLTSRPSIVQNNKPEVKVPFRNTNSTIIKNKKMPVSDGDESPYFYAVSNYNNNKVRLDQNSVKQYLKFVKNITITYPVMIPTRNLMKNNNQKKSQKLKEKSRDINSNRNLKLVVPTTTTENPLTTKNALTTQKETTGEVRFWQLTLYGTATPPAHDGKVDGTNTIPDTFGEDIFANSIYDSSSNWDSGAENRKDILEVEEKETSGCSQSKGNLCLDSGISQFGVNMFVTIIQGDSRQILKIWICNRFQGASIHLKYAGPLEKSIFSACLPNYQLYKGMCLKSCPEKSYNTLLDEVGVSVTKNLLKNQTCSPCHYTCKHCWGSLDSNCLECFNDAELVTASTESYCYPVHIISEGLSEKWYYRMFTTTYIVIACLAISTVIYFYFKRQKGDNRKNIYDIVPDLSVGTDVKTSVYRDSEW